MKKPILMLVLTVVFAIAALQFIRLNNDHRECEKKVETYRNTKGEMVVQKQHLCKEVFSF